MGFDITAQMHSSVKKCIRNEGKIAKRVIKALLKAGYKLGVNDGEEVTVKNSADVECLYSALRTTDEDFLLVYKDGSEAHSSFVRFIYGNGNNGADVVADYSVSLEAALKPVNDWVERTFD